MSDARHPFGNVTFVFTDIEGSSKMTRQLDALGAGLYETHLRDPQRRRLWDAVTRHGGVEVDRAGDGHFFAFQRADDALAAVVSFKHSLAADPIAYAGDGGGWSVRVRVGVHTAAVQIEPRPAPDGKVEYSGNDINFAARIGSLGGGGQVILSAETRRVARGIGAYRLRPWPGRLLKSFEDRPEDVYEILYLPGQQPREPGSRFFPEFFTGERNHYVARLEEEEEVLAQFRDRRNDGRSARLVTVLADGGMGKTRLAVACAVRMAGAFANGVYFVDLAQVAPSPEAVAEAIGQALGLGGTTALPDNLFQALRERNTLLVLDNYESCKSPAAGEYLARLVTDTRGVCLLATGRVPVGASEVEQRVSLDDGMTADEARELFTARARLKGQLRDEPTPAEAAELRRIIGLTERIPLALELAAAWVEYRTLKEIADGLEATPLGNETGPPPDEFRADEHVTGGRHRSLERSLDWSYGLLVRGGSAGTQRVFEACGLFADTFDAATVAAVIGETAARAELVRLQGRSLVRRVEVDGETRYRLHRFTRGYAAKRFAERADADEMRRRFVGHYVKLADENFGRLSDLVRLALLDKEWPNVVAAAGVAEALQDHGAVVRLSALDEFLNFRGLWSEAERLNLLALDAARADGHRKNVGGVLNNLVVLDKSSATNSAHRSARLRGRVRVVEVCRCAVGSLAS